MIDATRMRSGLSATRTPQVGHDPLSEQTRLPHRPQIWFGIRVSMLSGAGEIASGDAGYQRWRAANVRCRTFGQRGGLYHDRFRVR